MRFEIKSFRTRVARRIFLLFVLCALLPVTTLAAVSYFQVRSQLMDHSTLRLREENKAVAVSIYERLLFLRSEIRAVAALFASGSPAPLGSADSGIASHFEGIAVQNEKGLEVFTGQVAPLPELNAGQRRHLEEGKTLLLDGPGPTDRLFLVVQVRTGENAALLVGALSEDYLWEAAERRPPATDAFVLGDRREFLYSSVPEDTGFFSRAAGRVGDDHAGLFEWEEDGQESLASYTSLFLSTNFYYPKWTVVLSQSKEQIFAPMASFKIVFPVLVALTLAMVFILSVNLIHRSLGPIETLQEATATIAGGDYTQPVEINSGDEFETLGRSFNEMRKKIEESQNLVVRTAKMATMGQMSGGIIHEIKQPLAAIHGQIQLLQLNPDLSEEEKDRMGAVMEAVERMNTTMGRFTAFSHMGEGKMQSVYLPDVVERIHKLLDHQFMRKGITYTEDHQPKLPNIQGDLQGMQQVISNMMINAIHAIEEKNGENPTIAVHTRMEDGEIVLEIEDTGCGMPEDVIAHIYDPFFTTKEPGKGTGLGMPIVESILHKHGATIDVKSRVGVGTRFTMRFPVGGRREEA